MAMKGVLIGTAYRQTVLKMTEQDSYVEQLVATPEEEFASGDSEAMPGLASIEFLTLLARQKWLIGLVTGTSMIIGIIISLTLPVRYIASTSIMTPQQNQSTAAMLMNQIANSGAGAAPLAAAASGGGLGLKNPNDLYVGLLKSRPIADAIIHEFELMGVYKAKDMTAARKKLADNTKIVSEKSGFISISVTDGDKKRAAEVANAYTEQLHVATKTLAVTEASQRRLFYEDQLKLAKDELISAEFAFQQVQQKKGLVQLDAQAKAMIEGLAVLRGQIAAKEVEIQALRSYSTDRNPQVQLAERELSSLRGQVTGLEQRSHSSGFSELGLEDVPGAGMDYLRAEYEVKSRQAVFDLLLRQYDAAKLDESKDAPVIQVVESAIPPDRKSKPERAKVVLLSILLGFIGTCSFIWARTFIQQREDLSSSLAGLSSALKER